MERPELSAVVLCYRAEENLLRVIEPLYDQLRAGDISSELVLVANYDEGREDRTPSVVEEFARSREGVRTVTRPKQGAMGWDMRSGLEAASGKYLIVMDGDAQNPVEDVLALHGELKRTGADVVKGRRIQRGDGPYRRTISFGYNLLFRFLFHTGEIWDVNGKPKGMRREAYERLNLSSDDWFIDAEIVLEAQRLGMTIVEIPVVFRRNEARHSFVRPAAIFEFLGNMLRYRFRRSR